VKNCKVSKTKVSKSFAVALFALLSKRKKHSTSSAAVGSDVTSQLIGRVIADQRSKSVRDQPFCT